MHTRKVNKDSVLDNMTFLGEQIEEMNITPKEKESLFKERVIEQLMAAAMMAEIDILAVDQLAESFRMKNEMLTIIRKDNYVT